MIKPTYHKCNTRSQMAMNIPLRQTNTGQPALSFLGSKIWAKISHSSKGIKITASFTHALRREILSKLFR